jgi:hypothetical protein
MLTYFVVGSTREETNILSELYFYELEAEEYLKNLSGQNTNIGYSLGIDFVEINKESWKKVIQDRQMNQDQVSVYY